MKNFSYPKWGIWFGLLTLFGVSSCRNDAPPRLSLVCTLDGAGGGDCADPGGNYVYKSPTDMKDYWATTQTDEANFTAWCYGTGPILVSAKLEQARARIKVAKAKYFSAQGA